MKIFLISVNTGSRESRPYGYVETEENAKHFCETNNKMIIEAVQRGDRSIVTFYGELYKFGEDDEFIYEKVSRLTLYKSGSSPAP